ncbi:MAG: signal peptidase I [Christensenellales bacterium]|jgi:signal peptidase I
MHERCAGVIGARRTAVLLRRGYARLALQMLVIAAAAWLLLTQVFLIAQVRGGDMDPALRDGDLLLAFRLQGSYAQDDVVLYTAGGQRRVGRVVAREGDVVSLDESGALSVNGTTQSARIFYATYAKEGLDYPVQVGPGCVFILGDHRTQAEDSRDFGPVPVADVQGKIITILRRQGL